MDSASMCKEEFDRLEAARKERDDLIACTECDIIQSIRGHGLKLGEAERLLNGIVQDLASEARGLQVAELLDRGYEQRKGEKG